MAGIAPGNFVITKELALSSDIKLACWCPTMDLCAVVSTDGQLQLHRMDWQLLWAASPDALVTAICWRPDGKEIAVGYSNGGISILDVESGETVMEHKGAHYAGIRTVVWADMTEGLEAACKEPEDDLTAARNLVQHENLLFTQNHSVLPHQRYKRLFAPPILEPLPPSSAEPLPNPYDLSIDAPAVAAWPAEQPGLSVLTAADVRGRVTLWLQGQVQLAEFAGNTACSSDSSRVEQDGLGLTQLHLMHVALNSTLDRVLLVNRSSSGALLLVSQSLQMLHQYRQPLQQCAALFSQLRMFLAAALRCLETCSQDWSTALADFNKRFDTQFKQELADQGSAISAPQQELLLLLATGSCTPPLQSFLGSTLGEANLRRLARSLDSTANGLHTALLERVQPLLELVLFLVGELRGCVAAAAGGDNGGRGFKGTDSTQGSWLGLQVTAMKQLELHVAALLLRLEQLRRVVTEVTCQYRTFFCWLLKMLRQLEGQDGSQDGTHGSDGGQATLPVCQDILAFLKGQFLSDVVGPELSGAPLSSEGQAKAVAVLYNGISLAETQQLLALVMDWMAPPLRPYSIGGGSLSTTLGMASQIKQQQRQPSAAALDLAAEACERSVAEQLQYVVTQCNDVFERPLMAISPSIQPISQLLLLPAVSSGCGGSSNTGGSTPQEVAVALPLLQPKQLTDSRLYFACLIQCSLAVAAVARSQYAAALQQSDTDGQQQSMLVVRITDAPSSQLHQPSAHHQQAASLVQALLLHFEAGQTAVAWEFYAKQQLALLTQNCTGGEMHDGSCSSSSTLSLIELSEAPWVDVPPNSSSTSSSSSGVVVGQSVVEHCLQMQAVVAVSRLPQRQRQLQAGLSEQLAVSRARGLASLVTNMQHLVLLDLEDDEEVEEREGSDMCE